MGGTLKAYRAQPKYEPAQREAARGPDPRTARALRRGRERCARPGPTARSAGPFDPWLRSPELSRRAMGLGDFIWQRTTLDRRLIELAILVTGRAWRSNVRVGRARALRARVRRRAGDDRRDLRAARPESAPEDELLVHDVARALHDTRDLPLDALPARRRALRRAGPGRAARDARLLHVRVDDAQCVRRADAGGGSAVPALSAREKPSKARLSMQEANASRARTCGTRREDPEPGGASLAGLSSPRPEAPAPRVRPLRRCTFPEWRRDGCSFRPVLGRARSSAAGRASGRSRRACR